MSKEYSVTLKLALKVVRVLYNILRELEKLSFGGGGGGRGPTLFLSVDFVNILPKKGVDRH